MNLCESNKAISKEVMDFMLNVRDVKEESITDYLVWKWRELDKRLHFVNIRPFTRQKENTLTGADFELELWIIGKAFNFPLLFQAKKILEDFDSYVAKLNYKGGTQDQLTRLIIYSKSRTPKLLPFYMFYIGKIDEKKAYAMCARNYIKESALFIADALTVKEVADKKYGNRISKYDLLAKSNPFHCIFCCPLSNPLNYFQYYFPKLYTELGYDIPQQTPLPEYVSYLLNNGNDKIQNQKMISLIKEYELSRIRNIAVYDLRETDI